MKLLIVATSRVVRAELIRQAKSAGHQVTALEPRRRFFRWKNRDVRFVVGDLLKTRSLVPGVAGQHAVICWLSAPSARKPTTFLSEGTANLMRAMYECGVHGLICISAFGVGDSRGHGGFFHDAVVQRVLQKGTYEDRERQEELIRYTDLAWIIVRPARVVRGELTGQYMSLTDMRNVRARKISLPDVVHFAIKQLNSNFYLHKTPLITY
jgi:putative NADH-flavin reductase